MSNESTTAKRETKMNYYMMNKETTTDAAAAVEVFALAGVAAYRKGTRVYFAPTASQDVQIEAAMVATL
jgi:hypothetical protein